MPKIFTGKPGKLEWFGLGLILVLAAVLRLGWPGNAEFSKDTVHLSQLALDMGHGRSFPVLGIGSSVGFPNAPMSVYLLAIPYALSDNPVVATSFVALLNVVGVVLLYALARRYYGPKVAIIATLLYAVSPREVIYSRFIWQQNMLPPFVIASVGTGLLGFLEGKRWAQLLHLPLLSITGQLHYAAIVLIPITLILIVAGRRNIRREFVYSLGLVALVTLPYIVGIAPLLNPAHLGSTLRLNGTSSGITITNAAVFDTAWAISGKLLRVKPGARPEDTLFSTLPFIVGIAALWLLFRTIRKRDSRSVIDLVLLVWLTGTSLIFSFTWTAVYLHYMHTMLPSAFLVLGVGVTDLLHTTTDKRFLRVAAPAVFVYISVIVVVDVLVAGIFAAAGNLPNVGDNIGVPLGFYMTVREAILAKQPDKVVFNPDAPANIYGYEQGVMSTLLYNVPSVQFESGGTDIYPAEKAVYVSHQCEGTAETFWIPNLKGCYAVEWHSAASLDLSSYIRVNKEAQSFVTGAQVIAYRWEPKQGCLSLAWKINEPMLPNDPPGYVGPNNLFALRFYNADRTSIRHVEEIGWQGAYLGVGDIATKSFCLTPNHQPVEEIVGVGVRMYITGGAQTYAARLIDSARQFTGTEQLTIPLVPKLGNAWQF